MRAVTAVLPIALLVAIAPCAAEEASVAVTSPRGRWVYVSGC